MTIKTHEPDSTQRPALAHRRIAPTVHVQRQRSGKLCTWRIVAAKLIDKAALAMIISFSSFIRRLFPRGTQRLSFYRRSHTRYLSTPTNKSSMFIYDGIRSQLEWNSTLSPAKAIRPTAETKYLRKVRHHPSSRANSTLIQPLDRYHRYDWCVSMLGGLSKILTSVAGPNTNSVERLAALRRAGVNVGQSPCR